MLAVQSCSSTHELAPLYTEMERDRLSEQNYTAVPGDTLFAESAPRDFAGAELEDALEAGPFDVNLPAGTELMERRIAGTNNVIYCSDDLFVTDFGRKRTAFCFRDTRDQGQFNKLELLEITPTTSVTREPQSIEALRYRTIRIPATGGHYEQRLVFVGEYEQQLTFLLELRDTQSGCVHRRETVRLDIPVNEPTGTYLKPWMALQPVPGNPQGAVSPDDMRRMGTNPEELSHYLSVLSWNAGIITYQMRFQPTKWAYRPPDGFENCAQQATGLPLAQRP